MLRLPSASPASARQRAPSPSLALPRLLPRPPLALPTPSLRLPVLSHPTPTPTHPRQICSSLVDNNSLFTWAWEAELWHSCLAILDYGKPYKEFPRLVTACLQRVLGADPSQPQSPSQFSWIDQKNEVAKLRKKHCSKHPNAYIFQVDRCIAVTSPSPHRLITMLITVAAPLLNVTFHRELTVTSLFTHRDHTVDTS